MKRFRYFCLSISAAVARTLGVLFNGAMVPRPARKP